METTVSVVQIEPVLGDKSSNLDKIEDYIGSICEHNEKTDLIIFPELITTGYECGDSFYRLAESFPDGPSIQRLSKIAASCNTCLVVGFPEKSTADESVLYNSAACIDRKGNPLGVYRKVHLFGGEKKIFSPGNQYPIFKTAFGRLGVFICWDTLFPEVARIYTLKKADVLVVPTNWEKPFSREWDLMTAARAFDNTLHLAAANRIGFDKTLGFFGHSRILGPLGETIKALDAEKEGFATARIDLEKTKQLRAGYWTQLQDRRADTYRALLRQ